MEGKKWEIKNGQLSKNFQFADFSQAIKFINWIAEAANQQNIRIFISIITTKWK